jgi:hypothetical protein
VNIAIFVEKSCTFSRDTILSLELVPAIQISLISGDKSKGQTVNKETSQGTFSGRHFSVKTNMWELEQCSQN